MDDRFFLSVHISQVYLHGGSVSKLHERTKLHEGTKLHEDTFARRQICTSGQNCAKTYLHGCQICTAVKFARRHFCTEGHFCTSDNFARKFFFLTLTLIFFLILKKKFF